jgi:hypothetical protein
MPAASLSAVAPLSGMRRYKHISAEEMPRPDYRNRVTNSFVSRYFVANNALSDRLLCTFMIGFPAVLLLL